MSKAKPSSAKPMGGRAHRILDGVTTALKRSRHSEATRLFKEGQSCGAIPADSQLDAWLGKSLGARGTVQLTKAFALTPCFFCRNGRQACEDCDGEGRHGDTLVCEACLGLGATRCSWCGGSGWVGMDFVPTVLKIPVLSHRAKTAIERLKALFQQPLPEPSQRNYSSALKKHGGALLVANSLLGVLENMVTAVDQLHTLPDKERARTDKLVDTAVRAAAKGYQYLGKTLQRMAIAAHLKAEDAAPDSVEKTLATNMSERYRILVESGDHVGTLLEHPFLRKAIRKAQTQQRVKTETSQVKAQRRERSGRQAPEGTPSGSRKGKKRDSGTKA